MITTRTLLLVALLTAAAALPACDSKKDAAATPQNPAAAAAAAPAFLLTAMPEGALSVVDAKAAAKEGQRVVVRGKIGGNRDPISQGAAVFVMMDTSEPDCTAEGSDGHCRTPWDYCCTAREVITAKSCTIQVVDDKGATLPIDLTASGIHPSDEVIVVGTAGPRASDAILVVHASGIYRVGG